MKTLAEIAIEGGLITKASAAKAGRMADENKQPLIAVLVRELHVDELALVAAIRKGTRVPLIDPADVEVDSEALRMLAKDVCQRLKVLPLAIANEPSGKVLRIAMADPTDTPAIAEIEELTRCEIELTTLPLSAIEELIDRGYTRVNTAVTARPKTSSTKLVALRRTQPSPIVVPIVEESSVTAQIPLSSLVGVSPEDTSVRLEALVELLIAKGVITEEELAEAVRKRSS